MYGLSGIFSLQEAMNTYQTAASSSINPTRLHLGNIQEILPKVPNTHPRYQQDILYDGTRLVLQTPAVRLNGLSRPDHPLGKSVGIPLTPWLNQQLSIIDEFVTANALIPDVLLNTWPEKRDNYYKPIYKGAVTNILESKYCCFSEGLNLESSEFVREPSAAPGLYSFAIQIPHLYIGPHRDGSLVSVSLRVVKVHCELELPDLDRIVEVQSTSPKKQTITNPPTKQRKRRQKQNVNTE